MYRWKKPNDFAKCGVNYTVTVAGKVVLDKSVEKMKNETVLLDLDDPALTEGLFRALITMKVGERATFEVQADYAYGVTGEKTLGDF